MPTTSVSYQAPTYVRTQIGSKPAHTFDQNDRAETPQVAFPSDSYELGGEVKVWGDVPIKNADGTPQLSTREAELNLVPRSPLKYGLVSGLLSAGVGAALGAVGSGSLGIAARLGAALGALALGGTAGGIAAFLVQGEQVATVWDTHQITDTRMLGYSEFVGPGERNGASGYFHRFVPDLQETVLGTYQTPRALRYKKEAPKV